MWSQVESHLSGSPAKLKVAKSILELGLTVREDGRIYCGPIEIAPLKMARALGLDRRVIGDTVRAILEEPSLREVFTKVMPAGPSFREVARRFGFGVVVITADPKTVGVVAKVATMIAKEGVGIRQILAEDPELFPEPKLTVITDGELPGNVIPEFLKVKGVKGVHVY